MNSGNTLTPPTSDTKRFTSSMLANAKCPEYASEWITFKLEPNLK